MSTKIKNAQETNTDLQQPMKPEEVSSEQKQEQKAELKREGNNLTANPGDRIDDSMSIEEKAKQVAVDAPDGTGDHVVLPTLSSKVKKVNTKHCTMYKMQKKSLMSFVKPEQTRMEIGSGGKHS